ncbi:MAG: TerC family protein [Flavobacteriales bacterium]|nr:TerC family protein [Flavobacteriales bacterium]
MPDLSSPEIWISFLTLIFLEIVLGVDNIIFISILSDKLPENQQAKARQLGILLALLLRIAMLFGISWITQLTNPLFKLFTFEVTGKDLILFFGGLFLLTKSTKEIHQKVQNKEDHYNTSLKRISFTNVILQIIAMDVIFSLDSILTAVGLSREIWVMVAAMVLAVLVMLLLAERIAEFISKHPSLQILALSFLILIGFMLIIEAAHQHVPKGYIYFAVAYSVGVELLNLRRNKKSKDEGIQ